MLHISLRYSEISRIGWRLGNSAVNTSFQLSLIGKGKFKFVFMLSLLPPRHSPVRGILKNASSLSVSYLKSSSQTTPQNGLMPENSLGVSIAWRVGICPPCWRRLLSSLKAGNTVGSMTQRILHVSSNVSFWMGVSSSTIDLCHRTWCHHFTNRHNLSFTLSDRLMQRDYNESFSCCNIILLLYHVCQWRRWSSLQRWISSWASLISHPCQSSFSPRRIQSCKC